MSAIQRPLTPSKIVISVQYKNSLNDHSMSGPATWFTINEMATAHG
jgi:hypothetical protein